MSVTQTGTLIIGASLSGLALAAALQRHQLDYIVIEKHGQVCMPWRNHYERLHLHTSKGLSNLPYKKFGRSIPRYPSRQQVIDYATDYQRTLNIDPVFNTEALSVKREGEQWVTVTPNGIYRSKYLVMATGAFSKPKPFHLTGLETFTGKILHSSAYKTGKDFSGQQVLVVGFGNSACEIAIDLYEQGATVSMSVRSAVNVVPRDVLGLPVLNVSLLMKSLPPRIADAVSAPLMRLLIGDIEKLGLRKMPYGPLEQIRRDGNAPVLDIGTIRHIREGHIRIFGDVDHVEGDTIYFANGKNAKFDAIISAIGYYRNYEEILHVDKSRFEDLRVSVDKQKYFGKDGLYFCGYWISPTGQIREIGLDAKKIARHINKQN